jgi:hypothetical protein
MALHGLLQGSFYLYHLLGFHDHVFISVDDTEVAWQLFFWWDPLQMCQQITPIIQIPII